MLDIGSDQIEVTTHARKEQAEVHDLAGDDNPGRFLPENFPFAVQLNEVADVEGKQGTSDLRGVFKLVFIGNRLVCATHLVATFRIVAIFSQHLSKAWRQVLVGEKS